MTDFHRQKNSGRKNPVNTQKEKKVNPRELVLEIMMEVAEKDSYIHLILGNVLDKYAYLPRQDRAYITRTSFGTVERLMTLDDVLNTYSKTPVKKMKPIIRNILRIGVYEILFMDGVPNHAVVNESVKLAVSRGFSGLKGFVNGVLRGIARDEEAGKNMISEKPEIKYSVPAWIIDKWNLQYLPQQVEEMLQTFLKPSPLVIRISKETDRPALKKAMEERGILVTPTPLENAWIISGFDRLKKVPGYASGGFQIQDLSSILVGERIRKVLNPADRMLTCLDVCAAPGGKSLHLADMGYDVTACDISEQKTSLIEENFRRGTRLHEDLKYRILIQDARIHVPEWESAYDLVLADLPCSGLGVLGRKPDLKYRITPESLTSIVRLQREILDNVVSYVKPGGILVYSTCTINVEENEQQAEYLTEQKELSCISREQLLPGEKWKGDGFFISLFRKPI